MNWYKKSQLGLDMCQQDYNPKILQLKSVIKSNIPVEIDNFTVDADAARGILHIFNQLDCDGKERYIKMKIQDMVNVSIDMSH